VARNGESMDLYLRLPPDTASHKLPNAKKWE
jgi:hypothetical protein